MLKAFPEAQVHTSLYDAGGTFPEFGGASVRTSALDRSRILRRHHRLALPLLAASFARQRVEGDVVICSSSGWAHGARVDGRKVVYCYSPARWLYDGPRYVGEGHRAVAAVATRLRPPLVRWDRRAAASADRYLTTSTVVRDRIRVQYGIEAEVVPPPPALGPDGPAVVTPGLDPGFFLCVSRLLPYKNVDAVVAAFARLPGEQLVVVGAGPEMAELKTGAGKNVTFTGPVPDDRLRWLYRECQAVVAASYEDYGLTPLEGAWFGKPAVVLRAGGFLDTVREGASGVFFDAPEPEQLAAAVRIASTTCWSVPELQQQARRFGEERFVARLRDVVAEEASALNRAG